MPRFVLQAKANKEEPRDCFVCGKQVYAAEKLKLENKVFHRPCFRCYKCDKGLRYILRNKFIFPALNAHIHTNTQIHADTYMCTDT